MIRAIVLAACAGLASQASAQVVINEVYPNPPGSSGSGDNLWEFIELYGQPGMSLDGYMIASVFGGADPDNDNLPGPRPDSGWDRGDEIGEIDEAWSLDGLSIGSNGFLVLFQNSAGNGQVPGVLPAATTRRSFQLSHIPTNDTGNRIKNDGSATFILIRKRPFHEFDPAIGQSVYDGVPASSIVWGVGIYPPAIRYAWRKDVDQDVNFDGKIDLNGVGLSASTLLPLPPEAPVQSEDPSPLGIVGAPRTLEPYQMIDDLAWSNGGGKEYVRSSQQEISETSGFNPDAVARVNFFFANPDLGDRLDGVGGVVRTRMADEEFIYGDVGSVATNAFVSPAFGPTVPGQTVGSRFTRLNAAGFRLTPGTFNDGTAVGGSVTQFRFVRGDVNFDRVVDCADVTLATSYLGASLDNTITKVRDNDTPADPSDDVVIPNYWKWQGRDAQSLLATLGMVADGALVTQADIDAILALVPGGCASACPCPLDYDNSGSDIPDIDDLIAFFNDFNDGLGSADVDCTGEGSVPDIDDILYFFDAFNGTGACAP